MIDLSEDELFRIERIIAWSCEQALEVNGWDVTWFVSDSNRMLVEKRGDDPILEKDREDELKLVRKYLREVIGMDTEAIDDAIKLYDEKVDEGLLPYISGIEVAIDGAALIEKYVREHPNEIVSEDNDAVPRKCTSDIIPNCSLGVSK